MRHASGNDVRLRARLVAFLRSASVAYFVLRAPSELVLGMVCGYSGWESTVGVEGGGRMSLTIFAGSGSESGPARLTGVCMCLGAGSSRSTCIA